MTLPACGRCLSVYSTPNMITANRFDQVLQHHGEHFVDHATCLLHQLFWLGEFIIAMWQQILLMLHVRLEHGSGDLLCIPY